MIKTENFPNAYKEVYVILNYLEEELVCKIPQDFINMIKNRMNKDYEFVYNEEKDFEEQEILQETKVVFAYIFLNYWGTKEQNDKILKKFDEDIRKEEQGKTQYNPDEIFKKKKENIEESVDNKEKQIVEHKEETLLKRILNKILKIFRKK